MCYLRTLPISRTKTKLVYISEISYYMSTSGTDPKKESFSVNTVLWFRASAVLSIQEKLQARHYSTRSLQWQGAIRQKQFIGTKVWLGSHINNTVTSYTYLLVLRNQTKTETENLYVKILFYPSIIHLFNLLSVCLSI